MELLAAPRHNDEGWHYYAPEYQYDYVCQRTKSPQKLDLARGTLPARPQSLRHVRPFLKKRTGASPDEGVQNQWYTGPSL